MSISILQRPIISDTIGAVEKVWRFVQTGLSRLGVNGLLYCPSPRFTHDCLSEQGGTLKLVMCCLEMLSNGDRRDRALQDIT